MMAKNKKFRIGVIGAGAIAQGCHIPGYAKAKNCELVAVADPLQKCLDEVESKGWHFKNQYSDYKRMLKEEELDAVSICTPNYLHKEMAVAVLKTGCDLLLEKPIALTLSEANAIKRAAGKAKGRVMVGFSHRFDDRNIAIKQALKENRIGKPYMARIRFAHTGPIPGWAKTDWFYDKERAGGGAMLDMAIHAFDLIQWFLGPATSVQATVGTLRKKIDVDDNAVALLQFGDKCMGYVDVGWTSPAGFVGVEIMGDKGAIIYDYSTNSAIIKEGQITPDQKSTIVESELFKGNARPRWGAEMEHFTSMLECNKKFEADIDAGVASLKIALAAYKSSETGKRVAVK
jgi:predicted dehydrogenase